MYTILKTFLCYIFSNYIVTTLPPPTTNIVSYKQTPIFGGNEVQPEFSKLYMVNIANNQTNSLCNGVLINPYTVLSSASCVNNSNKILFHQHNLSRPFMEEGVLLRHIEKIILHPNYQYSDTGVSIWDAALLTFKKKVHYDPVQLNHEININEKYLSVIGWGKNARNGMISDVLRGTSGFRSISNEECSKKISNIRNHMLCIDERDVCPGNNGGALTLSMSNVLVGISAWNHLCGSVGHVGIYTRISSLQDWLKTYQIQ